MNTVLLITNRTPDDPGGRAGKMATREDLFESRGWEVVFARASEPYVLGFPTALIRCLLLARREDVDVVHSINNPFHLHVLGLVVSVLVGTPWLAELRDPIASHPDRNPAEVRTKLAGAAEWLVSRFATRIAWYDGIQLEQGYFNRQYGCPSDRVVKLPFIGYERAVFEDATPTTYDEFTITYAGSFYEGWIEPYDFLAGFGQYLSDTDTVAQAQFYGDWSSEYTAAATEAGVSDAIEVSEFVPYEEIVPKLLGSDILLYVGGDDPGNARNVPTKVYDYIGARTPILAIVDPSFRVADLIEMYNLGIVVPPGDPDALADALFRIRSESFEYAPDPTVFEQFTRDRSASALVDVLEETFETSS